VFGLAITARCDFAQRKFPILNYIPIVRIKDWLRRDGLDILLDQENSDQNGKIKGMLKQAGISNAILDSVPLQKIADVHFRDEGNKAQKAAAKKIREIIDEVESLRFARNSKCVDTTFSWFRQNRSKQVGEVIQRLAKHSILGHYLLEKIVSEDTDNLGYVCLLREVSTLPLVIAERLGNGVDRDTCGSLLAEDREAVNLNIGMGELAMPISEIGSPTIEHILQTFSTLFGRIGVADPIDDDVQSILENCLEPSAAEVSK
jgi:hypothetical protein